MKIKITPTKKKILLWTYIMIVPISVVATLMTYDVINKTLGGGIFMALMIIVAYGNYRIVRKPKEVKENGL